MCVIPYNNFEIDFCIPHEDTMKDASTLKDGIVLMLYKWKHERRRMKYGDKEEDINECTLVLNGCHLVLQLMIIYKIDIPFSIILSIRVQ